MRRWNDNTLRVSFIIFRFYKDNELELLLLLRIQNTRIQLPELPSSYVTLLTPDKDIGFAVIVNRKSQFHDIFYQNILELIAVIFHKDRAFHYRPSK
jgi:hypothetical protein